MWLRRIGTIIVLGAGVAVLASAPADADGGDSLVTCSGSACNLWANKPGSNPAPGTARADGNTPLCTNNLGQQVACSDSRYGTIGADGCYQRAASVDSPVPVIGSWQQEYCFGPGGVVDQGPMQWLLPGGTPAGPPAPVVLAAQAERQLRLPAPRIQASPAPEALQLVNVPTWLWLAPGTWGPVSATAAVPGLSVTATATPVRVVWSMGDGSTVTCDGPGTAFTTGADPAAASPDCGHTYRRSSAGQPGLRFGVTATVTWTVTWSGGGQQGVFPGLQTTGAAAFRVGESQALVTS